MRPENFDIDTLIEAVVGTSDTIDQHLSDGMEWEDLTDQDHQKIDESIFLCDQCGWWYEIGDEAEHDGHDTVCVQCYSSTEQEDEE